MQGQRVASMVNTVLILLFVLSLLFLCSCKDNDQSALNDYFQVDYQIDYSNITEDTAKQIAYNTLVDNLGLSPENYSIVKASLNQDIWLVSFLIDEEAFGGSVNIEVCAETGKVLSCFGGE